jgi:ElaB/YqjD/DUF883 family membrane-anchored ribosome-binding protein
MSDGNGDNQAVRNQLEDGRDWVVDRLAEADKQARSFLTEHPILALACAVGIGYLAARLLRPNK